MRALSLWQPWASLIADERKKIETRHWPMHYRGPLAIHGTKGNFDKEFAEECGYEVCKLPLGAIVCIVNVVRVRSLSAPRNAARPLRRLP